MEGLETSANITQEVAVPVEDTTPQIEQTTEVTPEQVSSNAETGAQEVETAEQPQQEEKPKQSAEENAKFAEMRRKHEAELAAERQRAKDEFIASQGYSWNGKPISTEAEYKQALAEKAEQDRIAELVEQNIPEQYAKEMVENERFRNEYKAKEAERSKQEAEQKEYIKFFEKHPDIKAEEFPIEVLKDFKENGTPLEVAYTAYENKQLKAELDALKKGEITSNVNAKNAASAIGSVSGEQAPAEYFTEEQVDQMSTAEVNKNWDKVVKSMKTWKRK